MTYLICRKVCREPTLALATARPCVWLTNTVVGTTTTNWSLYNSTIVKAGFLLVMWSVKTSHCSRITVALAQGEADDPTFDELIPFSSFKITLNQYRPSGNKWIATGTSKVGDFSEQGTVDGYLWAITEPSNSYKPIVFDYASYVGETLTLPSEFLEGKRLSGPDVSFVIDRYTESENLTAFGRFNGGSQMYLEYV